MCGNRSCTQGRESFVEEASTEECGVVLERSSFYAEQCGQIFDEEYVELEGNEVRRKQRCQTEKARTRLFDLRRKEE